MLPSGEHALEPLRRAHRATNGCPPFRAARDRDRHLDDRLKEVHLADNPSRALRAPNGFSSGGFANGDLFYAGNGVHSLNANSGNAVSQYDVACYQVSLHH